MGYEEGKNMKTIWKFELEVTDKQAKWMPNGAEILCVQMQGRKPCLWALVETDNNETERTILIYGTGNPISESYFALKYIDTFQMHDGGLVWHVFEKVIY